MTLRQKTLKGLFWAFVSQGGKQLIQFVITVVLARLLMPDDFGLFAMAAVFVNFAMIFGEMGIDSALIQKQDTRDRHYHSAFWLNVFTGICLTLVFISISPLVARFYNKPQLQPVLMVISLNLFLSSFATIQEALLTKEMDFKKLAARDVFALIISGAVGVYSAYKGSGVWSLVYQSLTFTLCSSSMLWMLSPWRPRLQFAKSDIKDIFHFSANLTGFNIVNYFARNIDQLLIGKFLGAQVLGYYSLAYKIMLYPLQNISWVIGRVMFPAFSKIQSDLEKVRSAYLQVIKAISLVSFPLMAWLFVVAPEFINVIYGPKWHMVSYLVRILCFCGMAQSINTAVGNIILSQNMPSLQLKLGIGGAVFVLLAVSLGLKFGIIGVALFYMLEQLFWSVYAQRVVNRLIKLPNAIFIKELRTAILTAISVGLGAALVKISIPRIPDLTALIACFLFGILIYIITLAFLKPRNS